MNRASNRLVPLILLQIVSPLLIPCTLVAGPELPPLIPRTVLFGNPERAGAQLSPDGMRLAYLRGGEVWLRTLGRDDDRLVTRDVPGFAWAANGQHLLFRQDQQGNENWHVFAIDVADGKIRDLTPYPGVRAQEILHGGNRINEILVGLNRPDKRVFDLYRINLDTATTTLEAENPGDVISWAVDEEGVVRACTAFGGADAHTTVLVRHNAKSPWRDLLTIPFADCCFYGQVNGGSLVAGFAPGGKSLYVVNPLQSDKTRLVELDVETGREIREIASDSRCDVEYELGGGLANFTPSVVTDPISGRVQAVGFTYARLEWKVVDPALSEDFAVLAKAHEGTFEIISRAKSDTLWLVQYTRPDGPGAYVLYDRTTRKIDLVFHDRLALATYKLAAMESTIITTRDGMKMLCYLTVPPGVDRKKLPLVLLPHGGPWWRDRGHFDPWVQLLANRGYAVLQPQYRGSTGFGKAHFNAANRQFGDQAVMRDLLDAVQWAVDSGLADPNRLAVAGGSAGGYTTLCCIAFHPEKWKCAVDLVGPSSIKTLLQSIPAYWKQVKQRWVLRFGDAEHDDAWEREISPLYHATNIRAPLLIGHGLNVPRVQTMQAERLVEVMRAKDLPVTLVVYPDEGHGFARVENNLDFFGRVETFFAKHLAGRYEPWKQVPGSSAQVK